MEKKGSILVVDDEETVRTFLAEELKSLKYEVDKAETAMQALKLMASKRYDISFIDIKMPEMSGLQLLDKIKELKIETIPVIITAFKSPETAIAAIEKGAYDYVNKPILLEDVEILIARALKRHEIELKRRQAFQRNEEQFSKFNGEASALLDEIKSLKEEVNQLLAQQGKPKKY
ncbi:MAG: response regulator [bacterium]